MSKKVSIFDSTLRDGAQAEGISFSVEDKLKRASGLTGGRRLPDECVRRV